MRITRTHTRFVATVVLLLTAGGASACSSSPTQSASSLRALPAVASAGCTSTPAPTTADAITFNTGAKSGYYFMEVPPASSKGSPVPLVLNLHGYEEPASIQDSGSGLPAFGTTHGFYVVTPQLDESGLPRWDFSPGSADVTWISDLLTQVEKTRCIDERRVYATGLSMGAYTTSSLACQLSGRLGAVAPVAGIQAYPWCKATRPVPVIAFHGDADPILAFSGGLGPAGKALPNPDGTGTIGDTNSQGSNLRDAQSLKSIPTQAAEWAKRNGCGTPATTTMASSDTSKISYPCPADASVELYVVHGGGHSWPGGPAGVYPESIVGKETQTISADALMWEFFLNHPLPQAPVN